MFVCLFSRRVSDFLMGDVENGSVLGLPLTKKSRVSKNPIVLMCNNSFITVVLTECKAEFQQVCVCDVLCVPPAAPVKSLHCVFHALRKHTSLQSEPSVMSQGAAPFHLLAPPTPSLFVGALPSPSSPGV